MPLIQSNDTCWREAANKCKFIILLFQTFLICLLAPPSCGLVPWHSIEQTPAEPVAYMRDGVFVSADYVRSAVIAEIDGKAAVKTSDNLVKVSVGKHHVKVLCEEAKGKFNTNEFKGEAKVLEFEALIQRTYLVRCMPYTHWWIEDSENNQVVAGERFK
jgi:hypothetical protein